MSGNQRCPVCWATGKPGCECPSCQRPDCPFAERDKRRIEAFARFVVDAAKPGPLHPSANPSGVYQPIPRSGPVAPPPRDLDGETPPFERGSWQHAVDDFLVDYGRTSQSFPTPHDAVRWLVKVTGDAALACHGINPAAEDDCCGQTMPAGTRCAGCPHAKPADWLVPRRDFALHMGMLDAMKKQNPGYTLVTVPKGTYPKQDKDVPVIGYSTHIVAACDLPEDTVYKMTKAMASNVDTMAAVVKPIAGLTPKIIACLALFDVIEPVDERYSYRDLVAARDRRGDVDRQRVQRAVEHADVRADERVRGSRDDSVDEVVADGLWHAERRVCVRRGRREPRLPRGRVRGGGLHGVPGRAVGVAGAPTA